MKDCPSCGAKAPASAARCKECFHDFSDDTPKSRSFTGPLLLLASFAVTALLAAVVLWVITSRPLDQHVLVDEASHSVVWTTKYNSGIQTDRLEFSRIVSIEHAILVNGSFEVAAYTIDGQRRVIQEGKRSLIGSAEHYSKLMEKPLNEVDNTHGFGK